MRKSHEQSLAVDEAARLCQLPEHHVEETYPCTPQQIVQISENRSEVFHLILSFGPKGDMERWIRSVSRVVAMNTILRTRIVHHRSEYFQVVTKNQHATEHIPGILESFLGSGVPRGMSFGQPLFRTTAIGHYFVATLHHAIMDHWALNSFLREDAAMLYLGHEPIRRAPFKDFVSLCASIDRAKVNSFWTSRFNGYPSAWPTVAANTFARPSARLEQTIVLNLASKGVSESHIAWYAEAAWALTLSAYADNESVSYGMVMSGRSPLLGNAGNTLGPTTVEIPVHVNVQPNMTVDSFIKGRASALRELKSEPLFLQYGLENIAACSEAAKSASNFQSLFNIVPPQPISLPTTDEQAKSVALENVVKRSRGGFALTLNFRLAENVTMLEALYDPNVLTTMQIQRFLNQFEHDLSNLIQVPSSTRISQLCRLNPRDRLDILEWNAATTPRPDDFDSLNKVSNTVPDKSALGLIEMTRGIWIVDPTNSNMLLPIGSIGELLVELPSTTTCNHSLGQMSIQAISDPPPWYNAVRGKSSCLFKTGILGRYGNDGSVAATGKQENRIKVAGRMVQTEKVEETIGACNSVMSVVVVPRIISGRTRLAAVLTLDLPGDPHPDQEPLRSLQGAATQVVEKHLESIRKHAAAHLISEHLPFTWHVVSRLPHLEFGGIDRAAVRQWLKLSK